MCLSNDKWVQEKTKEMFQLLYVYTYSYRYLFILHMHLYLYVLMLSMGLKIYSEYIC